MKFLQTQSQLAEMVRVWPQQQPLTLLLRGAAPKAAPPGPSPPELSGSSSGSGSGPGLARALQVPQSETGAVFPAGAVGQSCPRPQGGVPGDSLRTR